MNTQALVAFASNPQIGAVAFNQGIYDHKRNLIRRFANIMYGLRFRITYPALSARKSLLCTTGETGYFRRAPLEKHMAEFTNEYFMGRRCVIGDDRFLTSMVLKEGYQAILQQSQAKVLTDCPNTFKNFIKQQLRWYRSNQKYSFKTLLGWIPGRPFLKTHLLAFLLLPYLWVGIVIWWLVNAQLNIYPIEILEKVPGLVILTWVVVGFFLSSFLKTLPYFWAHKEDYRVFPLYVLFSTFIILPTFVYALLTIGDQGGWGTKRSGPPSSKATIGIKLGIFILALILITPLLALEVMTPHDAMATSID
jgi:hyaluronan synthase